MLILLLRVTLMKTDSLWLLLGFLPIKALSRVSRVNNKGKELLLVVLQLSLAGFFKERMKLVLYGARMWISDQFSNRKRTKALWTIIAWDFRIFKILIGLEMILPLLLRMVRKIGLAQEMHLSKTLMGSW